MALIKRLAMRRKIRGVSEEMLAANPLFTTPQKPPPPPAPRVNSGRGACTAGRGLITASAGGSDTAASAGGSDTDAGRGSGTAERRAITTGQSCTRTCDPGVTTAGERCRAAGNGQAGATGLITASPGPGRTRAPAQTRARRT